MNASTASSQDRPTSSTNARPGSSPLDDLEQYHAPSWQQEIKAWIREYQTAATLGGFALGVFIGVWMRR